MPRYVFMEQQAERAGHAGNIFADRKQLGGNSDSAEWVYGHMKIPHILFAELGVSTKA